MDATQSEAWKFPPGATSVSQLLPEPSSVLQELLAPKHGRFWQSILAPQPAKLFIFLPSPPVLPSGCALLHLQQESQGREVFY